MNLKNTLKAKLEHYNLQDIAQKMGYSNKSITKATNRIEQVLSDPYLNLHGAAFDFKYSNQQFLMKLCEVVEIDINDFLDDLSSIEIAHTKMVNRYKSYIYAETDFKRNGETVFMLAAFQSLRYIHLDPEIQLLPVNEQLPFVQTLIKKHYADCNGTLKIWGIIKRYSFHCEADRKITINPNGTILEEIL